MTQKNPQVETSLLEVAGDSPNIRLIDFLIENDRDSWNLVEMKSQAGIGYSTLKILVPLLLEKNILIVSRVIGKSKLYSLNKKNPIVKKFYELYDAVNKEDFHALQKSLKS